jgi:D-beta-D-heptose 7-phosphate kinase/D-beta-D-heptose 1-phosphate adenosyltransferase
MDKLKQASVLVVGDVMLDSYWQGSTSRISPEAPVPVVHVNEQFHKAGGAGNVALNIAHLGAQSHLVAITGEDEAAQQLSQMLDEADIHLHFVTQVHLPTIKKLRIISQQQQLIRADFEAGFARLDKSPLTQVCQTQLPQCQAMIISDYGKGTLSDPMALIQAARKMGVPVLVDPKGTDFKRYYGASYITPNFKEFTDVVGPCPDEATLYDKGHQLITDLALEGLLVTRGSKGMALLRPDVEPVTVPTQAREVFDVTGAGDTVIAVMAMSLAAGYDPVTSMKYANAAAGVVVGKLGTATVSGNELYAALHDASHIRTGVLTQEQASAIIEKAHLQGEKVVMTNGCFDILHAGHIDYLQAARALGDRLIVAVNDDASVTRLKGPTRPVNTLAQRMHVLEALDAVDWVVPFAEDTPAELVTYLSPDVLVKGADYEIHQIAGADYVLANGGEVKTITLTPGCSTTATIERIQQGE